ncbi:hypothetical protein A2U01_0090409, partial [Trifolium medium]|nr:hypothetical protein [Trifolium medium]
NWVLDLSWERRAVALAQGAVCRWTWIWVAGIGA